MERFKKDWSNVVTLGCIVLTALIETWQQATANVSPTVHLFRLQGFWNYAPLLLLITAGVVWLAGQKKPTQPTTEVQVANPPLTPGIPTLSSLLGQNSNPTFDAKGFFALAHYSPITAEIEKNIKIVAQQNSPNDKEAFYARFIGVGLIAYQHDLSWFLIYKSQLDALAELNSRGLIPVADLKKHFNKAVTNHPNTYRNYVFDQWLGFMKSRMLIARYPSGMVELSFFGKDFMKYLTHVGWDLRLKSN